MEKTRSEKLFERFCTDNRLRFCRIDEQGNKKTPDYEVFPKDNRVIVEIKELTPNDDDKATLSKVRTDGVASQWEPTGQRIRQKIKTAAKQLKSRSNGQHPAMVVLFNNRTLGDIDHTDIKTAMYGDEIVRVRRHPNGTEEIDLRLGGKRQCTPTDNTSLSAVCLMWIHVTEPRLSIFHNVSSKCRLQCDWFRMAAVQQYSTNLNSDFNSGFPNWHRI